MRRRKFYLIWSYFRDWESCWVTASPPSSRTHVSLFRTSRRGITLKFNNLLTRRCSLHSCCCSTPSPSKLRSLPLFSFTSFFFHSLFTISCLSLFLSLSYQIEATWAIANALSNGTDEHVRYLVHQGCIDPMADVMVEADLSTLEAILEGFDHILRGSLTFLLLFFFFSFEYLSKSAWEGVENVSFSVNRANF